jgi:hypothetical protein
MANLAQAPEEKGAAISDPFDGTPYRMRRLLASGILLLVFVALVTASIVATIGFIGGFGTQ